MFLYLRYRSVALSQKQNVKHRNYCKRDGEFVGTIGWMAVIATILVLTHSYNRLV